MISKMAKLFIDNAELSVDSKKQCNYALQRVYTYEINNKCNVYEFSETELKNCLEKCFSDLSEKSIGSYTSRFNTYFSWLEINNYYKFNYDYRKVVSQVKRNLINKLTLTVFSRKEIYTLANSCRTARDGIIVALLFEGVNGSNGNRSNDITNIKYGDLSNTTLNIGSRHIELPKDFVDLYNKVYKQTVTNNSNSHDTITFPLDDEYLIKSENNKELKDRNNSQIVHNTFTKLRDYNQALNPDVLTISGECFYLSILEQFKGELTNDDYYKVIKRYNRKSSSIYNLKNIYKMYLKSNKYEKVDVTIYSHICNYILNQNLTPEESGFCTVDKELGIAGEKYIFNKLVDKYTLKKVKDVTLNGEGCDFIVDDNILRRYEVKSTRIKEDDIFRFHITLKELKMAKIYKSDFYLVVVCYVSDIPKNTYVIPNPLNVIGIEEYAKYVLDYAEKDICIPPEIQVNVGFDKIKRYKNNSL